MGEIEAMVRTDETQVKHFVVREATPERIERLYQMPEFLAQPTIVRENGLIFAGQGALLAFDRPSDVLAKLERWFPKEFTAARTAKRPTFRGHLRLFGPFSGWDSEPAAFLGLWNCMPQSAWLRPMENPFQRRLGHELPLVPMAGRDSSTQESDFGFCIHQRNGYLTARTEAQRGPNLADGQSIAARVAPVLRSKFAGFLSANACRGTGPDDCVLVLHLWASLASTDPSLAESLRALEPWVAPDAPLPALQKPVAQYGPGVQEGERRFDEGLRQAAFVRAKLLSVLNAPSSWPSGELPATLHQLTLLQQKLATAFDERWFYYELDYRNESVNPWRVVHANLDKHPHLREAVLAEADSLPDDAACKVHEQWLRKDDPALQTAYALQQMTSGRPLRCASPDWVWLREGASAAAIKLRDGYLGLLDGTESASLRDSLLTEMTAAGNACFEPGNGPAPAWLRQLCATWIAEPQTTPFRLKHSRLTLGREQQFSAITVPLPAELDVLDVTSGQGEWLTGLLRGMNAETRQKLQAFTVTLQQRNSRIMAATLWRHPRHETALLGLDLRQDEDANAYFLVGPQTFTAVELPPRFRDDSFELVRVSDLDQDGNLELWWARSFNRCQNDPSDLERDLDCTARSADMGELQGNVLSYFVKSPRRDPARVAGTALTLNARIPAATTSEEPACNALLLGSVLGSRLNLDFGGHEDNERGDLLGIACRTHPVRPEQTLVALFHNLNDKEGQPIEDRKGFVFAIIDVKRRQLLALYREDIEEDATIRVGESSLKIDTGRYNLAPGVRALGVRMGIGHSPRCADGGESDYLTLFVEDGSRLKPVLRNLPISAWRVATGGSSCGNGGGDGDRTIDRVTLTLRMAATSTAGWHDIDVVAQHDVEILGGAAIVPAKRETRKQSLGRLRAKDRSYATTNLMDRLWEGPRGRRPPPRRARGRGGGGGALSGARACRQFVVVRIHLRRSSGRIEKARIAAGLVH
ncbi:MAG: hypothetical protein IPJ62_17095 [Betaproteobacteria bacterium]|nr:hypothetical protein [Betaproteobacteria bacterium]